MEQLRVLDIVYGTSVDGPGLRTSIYFSGCNHHCPGCHNPRSWDAQAGMTMTVDELMSRIKEAEMPVTFSGGDPLQQPAEALAELARQIKDNGYDLWCFTGYRYEDIADNPRLTQVLRHVDVLVDGPFIESLRDTSLIFRGSSNQRLIKLNESTPESIVTWTSDF